MLSCADFNFLCVNLSIWNRLVHYPRFCGCHWTYMFEYGSFFLVYVHALNRFNSVLFFVILRDAAQRLSIEMKYVSTLFRWPSIHLIQYFPIKKKPVEKIDVIWNTKRTRLCQSRAHKHTHSLHLFSWFKCH